MFQMTDKLQKKLSNNQGSNQISFYHDDIVSSLAAGHCALLLHPDDISLFSTTYELIKKILANNLKVWYVPFGQSIFQNFSLESLLPDPNLPCLEEGVPRQNLDKTLVVWSLKHLRDHIVTKESTDPTWPDIILLDSLESLQYHDNAGTLLEEIVLNISNKTKLAAFLNHASNIDDIAHWIENTCLKKCISWEPSCTKEKYKNIAAFLNSTGEMSLFLDKKKISSTVKKSIKNNKENIELTQPWLKKLKSFSQMHQLMPALIVFKDDAECQRAFDNYEPSAKSNVKLMLHDISKILKTNPEIPECSIWQEVLTRRAGIVPPDHPGPWILLMELCLKHRLIDVLFLPLSKIKLLGITVNTVYLFTASIHDESLSYQHISQLKILASRALIACQSSNVDALMLRNLLAAPFKYQNNIVQPSPGFVLAILFKNHTVESLPIDKMLIQKLNSCENEKKFLSICSDILLELKDPLCKTTRSILELKTLRLTMELDATSLLNQRQKSFYYRRIHKKTLKMIAQHVNSMPCSLCSSNTSCHKRGSKKLQTLFFEAYPLMDELVGTKTLIKDDCQYHLHGLKALDLVDCGGKLTMAGYFGLYSGLEQPYLLACCAAQGKIYLELPHLAIAIIAGFIDNELEDMLLVNDYVTNKLNAAFNEISHIAKALMPTALTQGILLQLPMLSQAAAVHAWQAGKDLREISIATKTSPAQLHHLISSATYIFRRLKLISRQPPLEIKTEKLMLTI
jgi:hypothetical protein